MQDSPDYIKKKSFFDNIMTFYGRNVVVELLQDNSIDVHKLHMAKSNRDDGVIKKIRSLAKDRGIQVMMHDKQSLSRISKNSKQDQGVAIDIAAKNYKSSDQWLENLPSRFRLLALDGIQNPQNLGMIIRSAAAGNIDAILLPKDNSAKLSALVMKASAGTLFKLDIYHCKNLASVLSRLNNTAASIYSLSSHADVDIHQVKLAEQTVFVLGNESEGVGSKVEACCTQALRIPMNRQVESLNVAMTATILSFLP